MRIFQLQSDVDGVKAGTKLTGPLAILNQPTLGYYTDENLPNAPSDQCFFASAVERNPRLFKEITNETKA